MQAITGDSVLLKFEKARSALVDSLKRVEDIVPQSIGSQVVEVFLSFRKDCICFVLVNVIHFYLCNP